MKLTEKIKDILKSNWGDKACALDCYAEVKLIDPLSSWQCYLFAMDQDDDTVMCLIYHKAKGIDIYKTSFKELSAEYNEEGEYPIIDEEFRRIKIDQLVRRLTCET